MVPGRRPAPSETLTTGMVELMAEKPRTTQSCTQPLALGVMVSPAHGRSQVGGVSAPGIGPPRGSGVACCGASVSRAPRCARGYPPRPSTRTLHT